MDKLDIVIILFILAFVFIHQWKIASGHYEKVKPQLKDRFRWAMLSSMFPAIASIQERDFHLTILAIILFFFVLFNGSDYRRITE